MDLNDRMLRFEAPVDEMKLIYRVLHANLAQNIELMDSAFLHSLQTALQELAGREGIDATDHGAWDAWLGNEDAASCEERVAGRQVLSE